MRTRSEADAPLLDRLIRAAGDRGIIDASQATAMRALAAEIAADDLPPPVSSEARRAFNPVIIAYSVGAMLVLFALGWFLADRWRDLGAAGVLGVSALYTAAFAATARELGRRGFRVGGGLAATLAVAMTPVWTFALLRLAGEWPPATEWNDPLVQYQPWIASRWIILELATIGLGLAVMRRVRFVTLAIPVAAAFVALLVHAGQALGDPRLAWYTGPYYLAAVACLVLAIGYLIDQRQPAGEDYASWFYVAGAVVLLVAYLQLWNKIGPWRHALPLVAAALVVASLYLRRRVLLIAGGVAAFGYLAYLALDVFRRVVALPIALAGLGLLVIGGTVWMQRRFPSLVQRVSSDGAGGRKELPGGLIAAFGPVVIAVTALLFSVPEARERTIDREFRNDLNRRAASRAKSRGSAPATPSGGRGSDSTPGVPRGPSPR
jgi:hypothetical protein